MYVIDNGEVKIFPADFIAYYKDACRYKDKNLYSPKQSLNEDTCELISNMINNHSGKIFLAIDMSNVSSYPMHIFTNIKKINPYVFFYNISEPGISLRLEEDIEGSIINDDEKIVYFSQEKRAEVEELAHSDCKNYRRKQLAFIIEKILLKRDEEASGLYSNCYLSVKNLFREVIDLYYVAFSLARKVSGMKFDAFITSSKNGAILATILGDMLKTKEVHLIGVGPKYSMELGDSVESIKEGKRYLYIFDFMCTGAEYKIVSALINSKKAQLKGAVGISRYMKENSSFREKNIEVLVEADEINVPYLLAGDIESIRRLKGAYENE
jgi:orotate phosphoribosyltransferase